MSNKILIIGDSNHRGADCCEWKNPINNLTDYETVIIDASSLYRIWDLNYQSPGTTIVGTSPETRAILSNFNYVNKKILECLFIDVKLYILFQPTKTIKMSENNAATHTTNDWFPITTETVIESGTTVNIRNQTYQPYLKRLSKWSYYFNTNDYQQIHDFYEPKLITIYRYPIAADRQGNPLALDLSFAYRNYSSDTSHDLKSRMIILPVTNMHDTTDDIDTILGFSKSIDFNEAPEWIEKVTIPYESELKIELDETKSKLNRISSKYESLISHKLLLYENSFPLQNMCEITLQELGANIKESKVSDEFIVEYEGLEALIEVKGKNKSIDKDDIGQLITDIGQHVSKIGTPIKGLFIGNGWRNTLPEKREKGNTTTFPK